MVGQSPSLRWRVVRVGRDVSGRRSRLLCCARWGWLLVAAHSAFELFEITGTESAPVWPKHACYGRHLSGIETNGSSLGKVQLSRRRVHRSQGWEPEHLIFALRHCLHLHRIRSTLVHPDGSPTHAFGVRLGTFCGRGGGSISVVAAAASTMRWRVVLRADDECYPSKSVPHSSMPAVSLCVETPSGRYRASLERAASSGTSSGFAHRFRASLPPPSINTLHLHADDRRADLARSDSSLFPFVAAIRGVDMEERWPFLLPLARQ